MSLSETTLSAKPTSPEQPGRISKTVNYFASFVGLGMVDSALGATLLGLAENTRTDLSEISFLFVARSAGYLLGAFLGEARRLCDARICLSGGGGCADGWLDLR